MKDVAMMTYFEIHFFSNTCNDWIELHETDSINDNRYATIEEAKKAIADNMQMTWHYGENPKFRIVKVEKIEVK